MIYKIKKKLYNQDDSFAIRSVIGEVECLVKPMRIEKMITGYYVYNRDGAGIAQVTFESNTATISIAKDRGYYPGSLKLLRNATGGFEFVPFCPAPDDAEITAKLRIKPEDKKYSIWGNTKEYSFDIYYGSEVVMNVVRMLNDPKMYEANMSEGKGNLLICLLICLSVEILDATAENK